MNEEEFNGIINWLIKLIVVSRGGVDIVDKMFVEYKFFFIIKINLVVSGLRVK